MTDFECIFLDTRVNQQALPMRPEGQPDRGSPLSALELLEQWFSEIHDTSPDLSVTCVGGSTETSNTRWPLRAERP